MKRENAIRTLEGIQWDEDCGQEQCEECEYNRAVKLAIEALKAQHTPLAWMYVAPNGITQVRLHRWRNAQEWREIPLAAIPEGQVVIAD